MAEKTVEKKQQLQEQKHQKCKEWQQDQQKQLHQKQHQQKQQQNQPNKMKNQENRKKNYPKRQCLISPKQADKNTKKYSCYNNNLNKSVKKKSGFNGRNFLRIFRTPALYILLFIGFIYVVDFEKFVKIREVACYYVNKTVSILPPEMVTKGREAVEFIQPFAEVILQKANFFIQEASTFLNTNPLVKDHWTNVREISYICSARLVDYMRMLYLQTTSYCNDFKTKIFN